MGTEQLPPIRPLHPSPGHQMDPPDIVGRDGAVAAIWELLGRSRATLLLNEPRRIGKTSVLVRLCHEPPAPWLCVRQSLQGVSSTVGLVELALNGIQGHQTLGRRARNAARAFLGARRPRPPSKASSSSWRRRSRPTPSPIPKARRPPPRHWHCSAGSGSPGTRCRSGGSSPGPLASTTSSAGSAGTTC